MTRFVVDTNVAIAANGRNTHADDECQLACVENLESIMRDGIIAIDRDGLIFEEYINRLSLGEGFDNKGVGNMFLVHVFNNQYKNDYVRMFDVMPSIDDPDDLKGFEELPENQLDRSDRKFLAVAVVAEGVILNALDGDWNEQQALTDRLGVEVRQLCPQHG